MVGSRWYKIFNDLWSNKTRTALIVLSIAVGLFAVGTIISARTILSTELDNSFAAINPSSGTVLTLETFDEDFIRSVADMPGVAVADARRSIYARIETAPGEWQNIAIFAVKDFDAMQVNKVWPESGAWPPPEKEILIERAALAVIGKQVGDMIVLEMPDGKQRQMRIAGLAHDLAQMPAQVDNSPYGYISFETIEWLGQPYGYNELHIVADNPDDKDYAQTVINRVKTKAEKTGYTIPMSMTAEPGQLPLDDILQAVLMLMGTIGMLSLFLSAFLIINTVTALLAQQKRQIGVMKAVGASTNQLLGMYLVMVMFYGLMALTISIPLSIVGAKGLSQFMAALFNFDLSNVDIPPEASILQAVIGLTVPVLASLYPFIANLRISAAEAMSSYQMGKGRFGKGLIDRMLTGKKLWFTRFSLLRSRLLSLRNTFRSKGRLALTLLTLTLAGAIFASVFSIRASLFQSIDDYLQWWNFDILLVLSRPYRAHEISGQAEQLPEVASAGGWIQVPVRLVRADGSEGESIYLFGLSPGSKQINEPNIIQGRWLLPEDENALVVDTTFIREEPDYQIGDTVILKINGQEHELTLVGVMMGLILPVAYTNQDYIAPAVGKYGQADSLLVTTTIHDRESVSRIAADLETYFESKGIDVGSVATLADERAEVNATYNILISLLLIMALLLALVGGLGLMGTMSINVLERTREIGVLRAIGAPNRGVAQVFILEGIGIGLMSWVFGSLLSIPLSMALSDAVGMVMSGAPLSYNLTTEGMWLWLVLVTILSALASFVPARNASRMTVREVLAYE